MSKTIRHVPCGDGVLCGNASLTAWANQADCFRCCDRVGQLLALLLDAADGKDVRLRAARLARRWGFNEEVG